MSRLEMILLAVSVLSVSFNVFMIMYSRRLLTEFLSISEELGDIQQMTTNFANHIEAVYSLESFYGDETLQALLEHAQSFVPFFKYFIELSMVIFLHYFPNNIFDILIDISILLFI